MDWREYNHAALMRLWQNLRDQCRTYAEADDWLAKTGRLPNDPLRVELASAGRHVADVADRVREAVRDFQPYRPLVDSWIKYGMDSHIRPDFKVRGVTERKG